MKVVVLGANGMLGYTVLRFLKQQQMNAISFNERWTPDHAPHALEMLKKLEPDACINAIGVIPGRGVDLSTALWVNGTLPGWISKRIPSNCAMIHASSDAVFEAQATGRRWDDSQSPDTDFGRTKRQGELGLNRSNDWIIRCSIIGLESHTKRSLLSWFLSQTDSASGFTNQMWNGVTTLEWARISFGILDGQFNASQRIVQPATLPPVSKYTLLKIIARIFQHSIELSPIASTTAIQRSLIPNIPLSNSLDSQLIELREWWEDLKLYK